MDHMLRTKVRYTSLSFERVSPSPRIGQFMFTLSLFARRTFRRPFAVWVALAIGWGIAPVLSAAIYDMESGGGRSLRLNVPDDLEIVRGILIWGNGAGSDSRARATDPELVALASSMDFAVLATRNGEIFRTHPKSLFSNPLFLHSRTPAITPSCSTLLGSPSAFPTEAKCPSD